MSTSLRIAPVESPRDRRLFVDVSWNVMGKDPNWVPPLRSDIHHILEGRNNALAASGPRRFFLAFRGDRAVGRIGTGINEALNGNKGKALGYVTLFECAPDYEAAAALFDAAAGWLKQCGMRKVVGPVSPTNGDDYKGVLVDGFSGPPAFMNSYNPRYYPEFFVRYGFTKESDLFAYYYDLSLPIPSRMENAVAYACRRYGFHADAVDLGNMEREVKDIKLVLERAIPSDWANFTPPTTEDVWNMVHQLAPVADPEIIRIARTESGEPIGFGLAMPDLNQVLIKLNGRLGPVNLLRFMMLRRRVDGVRFFVLLVVPEYRNKGVTGAIFLEGLKAAARRGYRYCDGSTIGETNLPMRRSAEGVGGRHYRTYRIYEKDL